MIAEADGNGAPNPNMGMPGQLQGEVGVLDFDQDVADQDPVVGAEGDGSDDDPDIEVSKEIIPLVIFLRLEPPPSTIAAPGKDPTQHSKPLPRWRGRRGFGLLKQRRWWKFGSRGSGLGYSK